MFTKTIFQFVQQKNLISEIQDKVANDISLKDLKNTFNDEIIRTLQQKEDYKDTPFNTSTKNIEGDSQSKVILSSIVGRNNLDIEFSMLGGNFSFESKEGKSEHLILNYFLNQSIGYDGNKIMLNRNKVITSKPDFINNKVVISQLVGFKVHERPHETAQMYDELRVIPGVDRIAKSWCPSVDWIAFFRGKIHTITLYRTDYTVMSAGLAIARALGYKFDLAEEQVEGKTLVSGILSNQENSEITKKANEILKSYTNNLIQ